MFSLVHIAPGDPISALLPNDATQEMVEQARQEYGLDKPFLVQYAVWLGHVMQGDFGRSIRTRQRVGEAILERLPATFELGLTALTLSITLALVVGTTVSFVNKTGLLPKNWSSRNGGLRVD